MDEKTLLDVSKKLNILISLYLKKLTGEEGFSANEKRKQGVGEMVRYLSDFGLDAKDIAEIIGSPVQSVRTLLTPKRKK